MTLTSKYYVTIPDSVTVNVSQNKITVKGLLGTIDHNFPKDIFLSIQEKKIKLVAINESKRSRAILGTFRALISNMIIGVKNGFEKKLSLVGVGFRAKLTDNIIGLKIGFSHEIQHTLPNGIKAECPSQTEITIKGINKQLVGQVAADIRSYRRPEPYKGKGIRYTDEHIVIKETKKK